MSKSIKGLLAIATLAVLAACGGNRGGEVEEFVVVDPVPVTIEPTYTGKL